MARSIFFYTDSATFGGAEQSLFMLIDGLDRERWRPTLLLEEGPDGPPPLAAHLGKLEVELRTVRPLPLGARGAAAVPALARLLRRHRPDVFHATLSWPLAAKYALVAALVARVPATVATVQLFPHFELDRSSYWQLRAIARGIGRYVAVSADIATQLRARMDWPAEKIEVVYNAVRLDRFAVAAPAGLRERLAGGGRPLVLTTARLDAQKGHAVLLRAALEVPEAAFAFVGEGPLRADLEAEAAALGIGDRVAFLGHRTDVPELLAACDVFALPSLYEGSSLAVLEAMAAQRVVLSSAIGGTEELVDDGENGLLVPPGDAAALAAALRLLLGDAGRRDSLARGGRARVERDFTPETMTARLTGIYEELLERG